tara:strand:- start:837 stop:1298 length:462 start_codon:yes stop_codon:yes gene_type:complete
MALDEFSVYELEKHETKDIEDSHINGELTVVWRDWDEIINSPRMLYVNTVNPGEVKGPHLHKNRTSYFFCLQGKMLIIIRDKDGKYHEIQTNSGEPKLVRVSNGVAAAIMNPSNDISKILVLADISWKPDDNEMENVKFPDYNFKKNDNNATK